MYNDLIKNNDNIKASLIISFIQGPKVEVLSPIEAEYKVEFVNKTTGQTIHSSVIKNNCWTKCLYDYFIDWNIKVYQKEDNRFVLIEDHHLNFKDKRVYIALESKALGDTLSWFPYIDEFRKKHKCKVICSTFHNSLFENQYPELEFIKPGEPAHGIHAMYTIGWFYKEEGDVNLFKHPREFKDQSLLKTATDILGLEFKEVIPKINKPQVEKKKQIAFAIHSTAQAKYWNNPTGWQEVVDWCKEQGYEVILLSKEGDTYMGNNHPKGIKHPPLQSLEKVIEELCQSQAFIGISSGLSWLSWATKTPTILISGFTESYTEDSQCIRLASPEGKCSGCFNKFKLDAGDWNWCPVHKDTDRQFECTKLITSQQVIDALKTILK